MGKIPAPIKVPQKNTLIAFPDILTYLFVSPRIVGKVADIPNPNMQTPTHITVYDELKIRRIMLEIVASVISIASNYF